MNLSTPFKSFSCWIFLFCFLGLLGCASTAPVESQTGDDQWIPTVANPEFTRDDGPLILVDAAHGNFHTIDGRFSAFGELLRLDGYRVHSADAAVTLELLKDAGVFVIANAIYDGDDAESELPTPYVFTPDEISAIVDWVDNGGSLLLIADHMPFPGATANLANEFGVVFHNGFAMKSATEGGIFSFTRSSGLLADHPITRGRTELEKIESLTSFTGQAFHYASEVQPLMYMPDDWQVLMPIEEWEFDAYTPAMSTRGLIQGGVLRHGAGRVAIFGEAAMFTAQTAIRDGIVRHVGMNHPSAPENAQFVLNLMHWLSGRLDD
jgi:hypothetical protein